MICSGNGKYTIVAIWWRIVGILRSPEGCPWDREQTHESIRKNLIEETYEVLETIDEDDPEHMQEEQ